MIQIYNTEHTIKHKASNPNAQMDTNSSAVMVIRFIQCSRGLFIYTKGKCVKVKQIKLIKYKHLSL